MKLKGVKLSGPGLKPRYKRNQVMLSTRPRPPTVRTLNKKIKRIQGKEELKHLDTSIAVNAVSTGTFTLLNGMAQGDTDILREGNDISATSLQLRLQYVASSAALDTTQVRTIVLWDSQSNGAAPTVAQILDTSVISSALIAPYNRNYQKRFKILHDRYITLNPQVVLTTTAGSTTALIPVDRLYRRRIKLSRTVKYIDNGATITSIATNSLYILNISDTTANHPSIAMGIRFYFKDD